MRKPASPLVKYYPFEASPRKPKVALPDLACDCQIHVFGPVNQYPVREGAAYEAPNATFSKARHIHRLLGIQRGLIVQPTTYGTDHRALLEALAIAGPVYRGCAVIDDSIDEKSLDALHQAGVRGARFNFFPALRMVPEMALFRRLLDRIAARGWYAKLNIPTGWFSEHASFLRTLDLPLIIDHFGRPDFTLGADDVSVRETCDALDRGNVWIMISNGHKLSKLGYPWNDAIPFARAFLDAAPNRVIWGSDWPHPLSTSPVPDDAELLEFLFRLVPDPAQRMQVLVENPAELFGFTA